MPTLTRDEWGTCSFLVSSWNIGGTWTLMSQSLGDGPFCGPSTAWPGPSKDHGESSRGKQAEKSASIRQGPSARVMGESTPGVQGQHPSFMVVGQVDSAKHPGSSPGSKAKTRLSQAPASSFPGRKHLMISVLEASKRHAHPPRGVGRSQPWGAECPLQAWQTHHSLVKGWNVHSLTLDSLKVSSRY